MRYAMVIMLFGLVPFFRRLLVVSIVGAGLVIYRGINPVEVINRNAVGRPRSGRGTLGICHD